MQETVYIVGCAQTNISHNSLQTAIIESVYHVVTQALKEAHLQIRDIDSVVTCSVDLFDGLTASNIALTEVIGAVMKPEMRISTDSLCALTHAAAQIRSGFYSKILVVGHCFPEIADFWSLSRWTLNPMIYQHLYLDWKSLAELEVKAMHPTFSRDYINNNLCGGACAIVLSSTSDTFDTWQFIDGNYAIASHYPDMGTTGKRPAVERLCDRLLNCSRRPPQPLEVKLCNYFPYEHQG